VDIATSSSSEARSGHYELLLELAYGLSGSLDVGEVLKEALSATRKLIEFRGGSIALVEDEHLSIAVADPPVGPEVAALRLPVGQGLSGRVASTGRSMYSRDLQNDERVSPNVRSLDTNSTIRSYFAVPVVASGDIVGVLQIDSENVDGFSEEQRAMVASLAPLIGAAIQNARVFTEELETQERLLELERLRSDFISITSHELRTPLTPLLGFAELLATRDASDLTTPTTEVIERLESAVERLRGLVEELQRLAQVEADALHLKSQPIDLVTVIEGTATPFMADRPMRLHLEGAGYATGDPERLGDALRCLLHNAVNFSPEGAPIEITTSSDGEGVVHIDVVDGGKGVPAEDAEKIFERFAQRESPQTRQVGGLGIGLPVARGLIEGMGGTLNVVPGTRGRFTITLPVRGPDA
jgi:signal transduction histidine kinase